MTYRPIGLSVDAEAHTCMGVCGPGRLPHLGALVVSFRPHRPHSMASPKSAWRPRLMVSPQSARTRGSHPAGRKPGKTWVSQHLCLPHLTMLICTLLFPLHRDFLLPLTFGAVVAYH